MDEEPLVVYADRDFKKRFLGHDFGPVQQGQMREKTVYLNNESKNFLFKVEWNIPDDDTRIVGLPDHMEAGEWKNVRIQFSPDESRIDSLTVDDSEINYSFWEVIG